MRKANLGGIGLLLILMLSGAQTAVLVLMGFGLIPWDSWWNLSPFAALVITGLLLSYWGSERNN